MSPLSNGAGRPDAAALVAAAITVLFVPGDRPERFGKAVRSGADVVIIDLEDAVAAEAKPLALKEATAALSPGAAEPVAAMVRVNAVDSPTYGAEIEAVRELAALPGNGLLGVVLPKAENPLQVAQLADRLAAATPLALVPLIESAAGVVNAVGLARVAGVTRLAVGAIDLALDLDADSDSPALDYARAQVVVASRAAGIAAPLDSPSTAITDVAAVERSARSGRAFGFGGKLCIHPAQLHAVRTAFLPTAEQITWAREVVAAGDAAIQVNGQMIDRPVAEKARRILRRAAAASS